MAIQCEICKISFATKSNKTRHVRRVHFGIEPKAKCHICKEILDNEDLLITHFDSEHPPQSSYKFKKSALDGTILAFTSLLHALLTIEALLVGSHFRDIVSLMDENLKTIPSFKIVLALFVVYVQSFIPSENEDASSRRVFFL